MCIRDRVKRDGAAKGAEALVRWVHPSRGILTPYAFIDSKSISYLMHSFLTSSLSLIHIFKKLVEEQKLGHVFRIESRVHGSRGIPGDWRKEKVHGGGMVLDLSLIHILRDIRR